jgi:hypothetical protein
VHTYATAKSVEPLGREKLNFPDVSDWATNVPDPIFRANVVGVPFTNDRKTCVGVPPPPRPHQKNCCPRNRRLHIQ